jgi:hypothetical protein
MSKGKLLGLILLVSALVLMSDFYSKVQEQKRQIQAAKEQEQRIKEQQAHEQRVQELKELNRQREELLRREDEQMRLQQDMLDQANKMKDKSMRAAKLARGLNMGAMFKMSISQFYQARGRMPLSNQEAGLESPQAYAEGAVAAVEIRDGGVIALVYSQDADIKSGDIYLRPVERAFGLGWSCQSPDYRDINSLLPSCVYDRERIAKTL